MTTAETASARPANNKPGTDAASTTQPDSVTLTAWTEGYLAGYDRGYEARTADENAAWPPPRIFAFGRWYDQAIEREKADAETRRLVAEAGGR